MGRYRFAAQLLAACVVMNQTGAGIDADTITGLDAIGLGTHQRRQAKVDGVAIEQSGERLRHQCRHPQMLECLRRLLTR